MVAKIKAIELALENELQERNFYINQSKRTNHPVGKQMFTRIAEDEDEHYIRLNKIYLELSRQGKWPETVSTTIQNTNIMEVLLNIAKSVDFTASPDDDDRQALRIAIDFETQGYTDYMNLSDSAENQAEKDFFSRLAAIENEHLLSLKETLLYFEDPAAWFSQQEKSGLEG